MPKALICAATPRPVLKKKKKKSSLLFSVVEDCLEENTGVTKCLLREYAREPPFWQCLAGLKEAFPASGMDRDGCVSLAAMKSTHRIHVL